MSSPKLVLKDDIDHIRLRPGMYIGSTYNPNHLGHEVLDNAFDELINGFANEICLEFISDDTLVITDNGRGIPNHEMVLPDKTVQNSIVVASTMLKSSAKFDNSAYTLSLGLHGIGLVAVNALSKYMRISVKDTNIKSKIHDFYFEDAKLIKYEILEFIVPWSTRIEFQADRSRFTHGNIDRNVFVERMKLAKANFRNATFKIDNVDIDDISLENFMTQIIDIQDNVAPIYKLNINQKTFKADIFITYDQYGVSSRDVRGSVNLKMCQGTYLTNITTIFSNEIIAEYPNVTKTEACNNLRIFINLFLSNPTFDSQNKATMTKDVSSELLCLKSEIIKIIKTKFIKDFIEKIIESKSMKKATKKVAKTLNRRVEAKNPLKDCLKLPGKTLYIVEGESADGNLGSFRDEYSEAILPITGKILNVLKSTVDKATDSKKFKYLLQALGVDLSIKNQQKFRYENVKLLCDADPD